MDKTKLEISLLDELAERCPDFVSDQAYELREGREIYALVYDKKIIRFHKIPDAGKIRTEQSLLHGLAGKGRYNLPQTTLMTEDGRISGQDRLPGLVLVPEDNSLPGTIKLSAMPDGQIDKLAIGLSDFLAAMHAQPKPEGLSEQFNLTSQHDARARECIAAFLRKYPDDPLNGALKTIMDAPKDERRTLLHGDFGYGNIIFEEQNPKRPVSILDFGSARTGPPSYDFANIAAMSPQLYARTLDLYNEKTGSRTDPRQPLLYQAASYTDFLLDDTAAADEKTRVRKRLENIAACLGTPNKTKVEFPGPEA